MRLKSGEIALIKKTAIECFGKNVRVYLFGSRTDDKKKGGDIDIYIETEVKKNLFDRKLKMLEVLHEKLEDQKIDLVINNFTASLDIYKIAQEEGILL